MALAEIKQRIDTKIAATKQKIHNTLIPVRREIAADIVGTFLPYTVDDPNNVLGDAEQFVADGGNVILATNHITNGEILREIALAMKRKGVFQWVEWVVPEARHQKGDPVQEKLGEFAVLHTKPITTPNTLKKESRLKAKGKKVRWKEGTSLWEGSSEYLRSAAKTMRTGKGTVTLIAPQMTREPIIGRPHPGEPLTKLLALTNSPRSKIDKVAVVFLGASMSHGDYKNDTGINPFRNYTIKVGDMMTREELLQSAKDHKTTVEWEVMGRLRKIAPKETRQDETPPLRRRAVLYLKDQR